jgi:hypothetical protein
MSQRTAVFSICTAQHLARARVLLASLRLHQPDWERHLCLVDRVEGRFDPETLGATLTLAEDLDLPERETLFLRYGVFEGCVAHKPYMALRLLDQGYDRVVYLDSDIEVYAPLSQIAEVLDRHPGLLSPHCLGPSGERRRERMLERSGAFNGGFFAVADAPVGRAFLDWWCQRLAYDCRPRRVGSADQCWLNLAAVDFPDLHVLRHPGYNVGHWNLFERSLEGLVFFHFSGFEPGTGILSYYGPPQRLEPGSPLAALAEGYAARLREAGEQEVGRWDFRLGPSVRQRAAYALRKWFKGS